MTELQFIKNKKNTQRILLSFINFQECVFMCVYSLVQTVETKGHGQRSPFNT